MKAILEFPPVSRADSSGLLCVGGDVEVESLVLAYRSGIFPWPLDEQTLAWFAPPRRCILKFDKFHIARSLQKFRRQTALRCTVNRDFEGVIRACAELKNRGEQDGTWITSWMIDAYIELHRAGHAHSVECYDGTRLVGGVYGVGIGAFFAGESMFYREPNASKLALWYLTEWLREQGAEWIDCQQLTPLLKSFGAREVSRAEFMELLRTAVESPPLFPMSGRAY